MIRLWGVLLTFAAAESGKHQLYPADLPYCSNRVVNEVVKRVGCTVGDARCWNTAGGMCTDYVEKRLGGGRGAKAAQLESVRPEEVRKGDVAVFLYRAHQAFVERVVKDGAGRPVSVDLAEYNFGTCWVDKERLVTERYGLVNRRADVAVGDVDGGFLRPGRVAR